MRNSYDCDKNMYKFKYYRYILICISSADIYGLPKQESECFINIIGIVANADNDEIVQLIFASDTQKSIPNLSTISFVIEIKEKLSIRLIILAYKI